MKNYFTLSELCITDSDIPQDVADKLLGFHIAQMNPVRHKLGHPVTASDKSGWRPEDYEKKRGRSGASQHCFNDDSLGAVDWTTTGNIEKLLELIMRHTNYSRVCYYPNNGFIHCDHKHTSRGRRYFQCASPASKWEYVGHISDIIAKADQ